MHHFCLVGESPVSALFSSPEFTCLEYCPLNLLSVCEQVRDESLSTRGSPRPGPPWQQWPALACTGTVAVAWATSAC